MKFYKLRQSNQFMNHATVNQKEPSSNGKDVYEYLLEDIKDRVKKGILTYKTPLKTHNGRNALVDLYQELIDAVFYVKQVLLELEDTDSWYKNAYEHLYKTLDETEEDLYKSKIRISFLENELKKYIDNIPDSKGPEWTLP